MANKNKQEFDQLLNNIDNAKEDVLASEALEDIKDTLEIDDLQSTLQEFDKSQSATTRTEDWKFSSLMLDKIMSDERYEEERQRYFEEVSKNANLDISKGAENTEAQYETAFNHMTAIKKKSFEKIAPIAYSDLQAEIDEMMSIQKARRMLLDAGVKAQDPPIRDDIAESLRLGYAFDQKFGDPEYKVDFEAELKKEAPGINKAFEVMSSDKAKKYAMVAAMGLATGGSSVAIKLGIGALKSAVKSETFQNTLEKAGMGFDSFLQNRGVDTGPLKSALKSMEEKSGKIKEKLLGTKWGKALTGVAVIGGAVAVGAATGYIDLEAIGEKALSIGNDFVEGLEQNSGLNNIKSPMAGFDGVENSSVIDRVETPEASENIEAAQTLETGSFQENYDWNGSDKAPEAPSASDANSWSKDTPGAQAQEANSWAKDTPGAPEEGYMDPRDNMVKLADVQPVSLTVEPGSSVYETVKAHMTEANGFPPSEQAVMQASSDIIAESGIDDPSKVPAGFEFDFNAQEYAYVESVSQETVDIARFGADGVPDGLKGQTLAEIASGKFDAVGGPVETRTTGQLMTEGAINGAVKSDIVNSIDKGLDPSMTIDDYMATLEQKVADYDSNVPPVDLESKSGLMGSLTHEKMEAVTLPEGHAAPTEIAGNDKVFENVQERQKHWRQEYGLGQ